MICFPDASVGQSFHMQSCVSRNTGDLSFMNKMGWDVVMTLQTGSWTLTIQ